MKLHARNNHQQCIRFSCLNAVYVLIALLLLKKHVVTSDVGLVHLPWFIWHAYLTERISSADVWKEQTWWNSWEWEAVHSRVKGCAEGCHSTASCWKNVASWAELTQPVRVIGHFLMLKYFAIPCYAETTISEPFGDLIKKTLCLCSAIRIMLG